MNSGGRLANAFTPAKSSGIVWCFGTESHSYHCTLAVVVAEAEA